MSTLYLTKEEYQLIETYAMLLGFVDDATEHHRKMDILEQLERSKQERWHHWYTMRKDLAETFLAWLQENTKAEVRMAGEQDPNLKTIYINW